VTDRRPASHLPSVGLAVVALLAAMLVVTAPVAAQAADQVKLALLPVGQPGSYFDLTMTPGETRTLEVAIGNDGEAAIAARTYAADVYTIINGGFGGRLRDQARTGMTVWLDYPTDVLHLTPTERTTRAFTVAVPANAGPGEYISSLVLENDEPVIAGHSLGVDQIYRQAVAVVVTVPGRRVPGLEIGAASHLVVGGTSVVRVAVENSGNIRLKPRVAFTLTDPGGSDISQAAIQMDTFYARTDTFVEFPLAALLRPGTYTVRLAVEDAGHDATATELGLPLVVEGPAVAVDAEGVVPGLFGVIDRATTDPLAAAALALALAMLVAMAIVSSVLIRRRRRPLAAAAIRHDQDG
jgi:hypothetical protein